MAGNIVTSYPTLQQAIQDWTRRTDLTDATFLPEIIRAAEDRIYQGFVDNKGTYWPGLRIKAMEKALPGGGVSGQTIVGGANYSAADTIAWSAPPAGGIQATGTLVITNGVITGHTWTNPGLGYTSAPTGIITTSTGSGGSVTATISTTATLSPSGNMAVPGDYLELKYAIMADGTPLERKSTQWIDLNYTLSSSSTPSFIARDGAVFITGPQPTQNFGLSGIYYYRDAQLSDSYTSNWIVNANVVNYASLMLACCLTEAFLFIRDPEKALYWEGRATQILRTLQAADAQERVSGGPLRSSPG